MIEALEALRIYYEYLYVREIPEAVSVFIPIEVKSPKKCKPSKSLNEYTDLFNPKVGYKVAPRNFGKTENCYSVPIYFIKKIIDETSV